MIRSALRARQYVIDGKVPKREMMPAASAETFLLAIESMPVGLVRCQLSNVRSLRYIGPMVNIR